MTTTPEVEVSRGAQSREDRLAATTRLVLENPRLAEIPATGSVLAVHTLGSA